MTTVAIKRSGSFWRSVLPCDYAAAEAVGVGAIADVVLVSFDRAVVGAREKHGILPVTDWTTLNCVLACRGRSLGTRALAATLGVSETTARRATGLALASGALVRDAVGFTTHPQWRPAARRLVALELKLRDWPRGLDQASYYSEWADASWLVLGASDADGAGAAAVEAGIGLARLGADGCVHVIAKPTRQRRFEERDRIWIGEQALAQYAADAVTRPAATSRGASAAAAA